MTNLECMLSGLGFYQIFNDVMTLSIFSFVMTMFSSGWLYGLSSNGRSRTLGSFTNIT